MAACEHGVIRLPLYGGAHASFPQFVVEAAALDVTQRRERERKIRTQPSKAAELLHKPRAPTGLAKDTVELAKSEPPWAFVGIRDGIDVTGSAGRQRPRGRDAPPRTTTPTPARRPPFRERTRSKRRRFLPVKTCSDLMRVKLGDDFKRRMGIRRPLVWTTPALLYRLRIDACGTTTDGEDGIDANFH
jgi:hypothetical protein